MPKKKLTIEQVKKVFIEYRHLSGRQIAKMYNVSHAVVNNIRAGRAWKNEIEWLTILHPGITTQTPKGDQSVQLPQDLKKEIKC